MPDAVVGLRHAKTTAGADVSGYDVSARFKLGGTLTFDSVRAVYLDGKRTSHLCLWFSLLLDRVEQLKL
eukprot:gene5041-4931_t